MCKKALNLPLLTKYPFPQQFSLKDVSISVSGTPSFWNPKFQEPQDSMDIFKLQQH